MAVADTAAPALTSLTLPSAIDVTNGTANAAFTVGASDTGLGVDYVAIHLDRSYQGTSGATEYVFVRDTADSFSDGRSTLNQSFSSLTGSGTYKVDYVYVYDKAGNSKYYNASDLAALGTATSFTVRSATGTDTTAPTLTSLTLPGVVDVTNGTANAAFTVGASDTGLGVDYVAIHLDQSYQGTSGATEYVFVRDTADSFSDGRSTLNQSFSSLTGSGTYKVDYVYVYDKAGNSKYYNASDLMALGIVTSFEVTDRNTSTPNNTTALTAHVTAPASVTEGKDVTLDVNLTLKNVTTASGTITLAYDATSSTATNGSDAVVPNYSGSYSVSRSPAGDYVINLPSIRITNDHVREGTETLAFRITAPGQIFDTGTNSTVIKVAIQDGLGTGTTRSFDYSGDGHSDILFQNVSGAISTWTVAGDADGNEVRQSAFDAGVASSWHALESFDLNGDGRSDILFRNDGGAVAAWTSNGGDFNQAALYHTPIGAEWRIAAAGDLNGDGRDDLMWQNANGSISSWTSTGSGFVENSYSHASPGGGWLVQGLGDFNGDGKADLLWRNTNGAIAVWGNNGNGGSFNEGTFYQASLPTSWHIDGIGDFNGDGKDDLLWRNDDGAVSMWRAAGQGFQQAVYNSKVDTSWQVAQVGDFDADGMADLLWRNDNGAVSTWESNGQGFDQAVYNSTVDTSWHVVAHEYLL